MDCQNLKEGLCVFVWYPRVEMPPSPRSGSNQKVVPAARGGHGCTRLLPSCHRRKFSAPHPPKELSLHDPAPAHHSAASPASVPTAHLEAMGITPPEPGTLFNDMSGQNVTALYEEARGWKCFKPRARVGCVLAFI